MMHNPPISQKFLNSPYFHEIEVFWFNLRIFASPYFDHDAFYALHVLDASGPI